MGLMALWSCIRCDRRWTSDISLEGKTVIVTGGNAGIGRETVRDLVARGARVIVACRDVAKGKEAVEEITADILKTHHLQPSITVKHLDLASLTSVRQFAQELLQEEKFINILINNAGVAGCPPGWRTEDGFDMQFGVNHLGHFVLTLMLLDRIKASAPARIVNVASMAHYLGKIHFEDINMERNYRPLKAYEQSKLANILFTKELAKKLEGTGVTTYSLHPGAIHTGLARHMDTSMGRIIGLTYNVVSRIFFKNVKDGAQTTLFCAVEPSLDNESGYYYSGCRRVQPSSRATNEETAAKLWVLSEKLTGTELR